MTKDAAELVMNDSRPHRIGNGIPIRHSTPASKTATISPKPLTPTGSCEERRRDEIDPPTLGCQPAERPVGQPSDGWGIVEEAEGAALEAAGLGGHSRAQALPAAHEYRRQRDADEPAIVRAPAAP